MNDKSSISNLDIRVAIGILCTQETFDKVWKDFWLAQWKGVVLGTSKQEPGIFLNILQLTGQFPTSRKVKSLSHVRLFATTGLQPTRLLHPRNFPSKSTGVGCHFLLQKIFPTQELNPGLLHCRQMLYRLSYQGSLSYTKELLQTSPVPRFRNPGRI